MSAKNPALTMRPFVESLEKRCLLSSSPLHVYAAAQPVLAVTPAINNFLKPTPIYVANVDITFAERSSEHTPFSTIALLRLGDGHAQKMVLSSDNSGTLTIDSAHGYARSGTYQVRIRLSGPAVGAVHQVVHVQPTSAGGRKLKAVAGRTFSGELGTVDAAALAASTNSIIEWGDGGASSPVFDQPVAGAQTASGRHTYRKPGRYEVLVIATYSGPPESAAPFGASVILASTMVVRR